VEQGQVQTYSWSQMRARTDVVNQPAIYLGRSTAVLDAALDAWLTDPANLIPVRGEGGRGPRSDLEAGTIIWTALETLVYGTEGKAAFTRSSTTGAARMQKVEDATAAGRVQKLTGTMSNLSLPMPCEGFASVTRRDGTTGPWRSQVSAVELTDEIRMVKAACYVLTAGLTMMRDSEIQEIERGALTTYYNAPAVTSRKIKKDPAQPELNWWISAPIVETLAVLERLSWHDTHLLVALDPPATDGQDEDTLRGIQAADEIDFFITGINTSLSRTGLEEIPASHVRPHMFRRTMSIICSQEPDSEIALGHQLKHLARRAMANRVTQGYSQMDANWAKEFDTQLELAAARRLVELLKSRRSGASVAVGPGAARLHAGLDHVISTMDSDPVLRAQLADEQIEVLLLRDQFADLHFGTVNHCLWDAGQAECQNSLPEDQRGQTPVLGACQPARCRNSVISRDKHAPIWLAEEVDLMRILRDKRPAKPRREALQNRLSEVQLITSSWPIEERI
jgi:integrase